MNVFLETALNALENGISTVPPKIGQKSPQAAWKKWQTERPSAARLRSMYGPHTTGVGLVCGNVSGGLVALDFDDRDAFSELKELMGVSGSSALLEKVRSGYCELTPNGLHLLYRCSSIAGNQKLAATSDNKVRIETRGEGGYLVVAPSRIGSALYEQVAGGFDSIAMLTPEEQDELLNYCRALDAGPARAAAVRRDPTPIEIGAGLRPGDDYAARRSWSDILTPHGWRCSGVTKAGKECWVRPGKSSGISATVNYGGSDLLYVFTTSTDFESEASYTKFAAYAILEHHGDFDAAASELRAQGYGENDLVSDEDLARIASSPLVQNFGKPKKRRVSEFLRPPGLVGDFASHIDSTSPNHQPIFSLAAAITVMAAAIGRGAMTEDGVRANLFTLILGESGSGKNHSLTKAMQLLVDCGVVELLAARVTSGAAMEDALARSPSMLYVMDEIGELFEALADPRSSGNTKSIAGTMLEMYTSSGKNYVTRSKAKTQDSDGGAMVIPYPSVSVLGATVPSGVYGTMTKKQIDKGILGRYLILESEDHYPVITGIVKPAPIPGDITARFLGWFKRDLGDGGLLAAAAGANPMVVPYTEQARDYSFEIKSEYQNRIRAERDAGRPHTLYTRAWEMGTKLALIRACGISADAPEITKPDLEWGFGLARASIEHAVSEIGEGVDTSKVGELHKKILTKLGKKQKSEGLTRVLYSEVYRLVGGARKDFRSAVGDLQAMGKLAVEKKKSGKGEYLAVVS